MNTAGENCEKCVVVHAVEELFDVRPPDETVRMGGEEFLSAFYTRQKPLTFTTRPRVVNKSFVINGDQIIIDQTVDHAIADWNNRNDPLFVVVDGKNTIGTMSITAAIQIFMEFQQILLQIILKMIQFPVGFFALTESKPAMPDIF